MNALPWLRKRKLHLKCFFTTVFPCESNVIIFHILLMLIFLTVPPHHRDIVSEWVFIKITFSFCFNFEKKILKAKLVACGKAGP